VTVPLLHVANTAGALLFPEARLDMVRVGLGIYGMRPAPDTAPHLDLKPAMRVVSRVSMVKRLEAGERPSYGRRRPLPAEATVATVPVGYADGVSRRLSDRGRVLIGGVPRPLAGTVTMDQLVVDMGDDAVAVGDEVVVLGRQGGGTISAEDWADLLETINYEVVCHFGPRLPRRYVRGSGRGI
jgi:alanine racemase